MAREREELRATDNFTNPLISMDILTFKLVSSNVKMKLYPDFFW